MLNRFRIIIAACLAAGLGSDAGAGVKDPARLLPEVAVPAPPAPDAGTLAQDQPAPDAGQEEDLTAPDPNAAPDEGISPDDLSLGEIPVVETMELTVDIAKRAIDSYVQVKAKYETADLEQYDNLQDFVDQNAQGKQFDADIKAAGFASVTAWNLAITTLGFANSALSDDPTTDINQQIAEITNDPDIAQDMKDRMIKSLNAMIPSQNNRAVVAELMKDAAYAEKLKQLDTEEE